jgi:hypothetical protein
MNFEFFFIQSITVFSLLNSHSMWKGTKGRNSIQSSIICAQVFWIRTALTKLGRELHLKGKVHWTKRKACILCLTLGSWHNQDINMMKRTTNPLWHRLFAAPLIQYNPPSWTTCSAATKNETSLHLNTWNKMVRLRDCAVIPGHLNCFTSFITPNTFSFSWRRGFEKSWQMLATTCLQYSLR